MTAHPVVVDGAPMGKADTSRCYRIVLRGRLGRTFADAFEGMTLSPRQGETWIAVLRGIDRFEGRSSLKTWIFGILANIAKTQAQRERRTVPLSTFELEGSDEAAVDAACFRSDGHWVSAPSRWSELPEERLAAGETLGCIARALGALPPAQRAVMTLRDVEGWSGEEVCATLGLTDANQRVLLHRARSKVRAAIDAELQV